MGTERFDDKGLARAVLASRSMRDQNYTCFDLYHKFGSPLEALWYSELLFPSLVEYRGMVFRRFVLESPSDRASVDAMLVEARVPGEIEQRMNLFEVEFAFYARSRDQLDTEGYYMLAERIARGWRSKILQDFPLRDYVVSVASDESSGVTVTMQRR